MTKQLNILFSCNEQYAVPLTVSITSIFENNKDSKITVYVLYSTLLDNQKKNLDTLAQQYNQNIILIQVESFFFKDSLELRWSKETYYRLLINELLPSDLERLLYLDCDIIINNDISKLYNINLDILTSTYVAFTLDILVKLGKLVKFDNLFLVFKYSSFLTTFVLPEYNISIWS